LLSELVYGSYLSAKKYLTGYDADTRTISLTQTLLKELSVSFEQWPRVTVTGSKGKGSTAVFLASILSASGEKVGLITSPHLRRFNERIRIDGTCVSDEELEEAARDIAPAVRSLIATIHPPKYLGPGGIVLALAAKLFIKHNVTSVIVEAGRGGEYDESRLIEANISIITPIMLKHAARIGPHLTDIARTKVRITHPQNVIITAPQKLAVQKVITSVAREFSSPVLQVGKTIRIMHKRQTLDATYADFFGEGFTYNNLSLSLLGSYQTENAAAAVLAGRILTQFGATCTKEGIYQGLRQVRWPGRCQLVQKIPWVLLDGAINKMSATEIIQIIKKLPAKRITAVLAIHRAQDLASVCSILANVVDNIILTEVHTTSLEWDKTDLIKSTSKYFKNPLYISDVNDAFNYIKNTIKKDDGVVLLGHQSFVGEALSYWNIDSCRLW